MHSPKIIKDLSVYRPNFGEKPFLSIIPILKINLPRDFLPLLIPVQNKQLWFLK